MERSGMPARTGGVTLPMFVALSFGLHVAVFRALEWRPPSPVQTFAPASQGLAGETLDVEPAPPAPEESEATDEAPATPTPATANAARPPIRPSPGPAALQTSASPASNASNAASSAAAHPALFGAVGVRFASDLATTFTRAFPQAASADPVWPTVPFGSMSSAELTLVLDDDGHLVHTTLAGSPSLALRNGIDRTLALLGTGRSFTAHGAVTRIRITSRVTRDDVHDGLHGDVFALSGGSFSGAVGNAFFALPPVAGPGRRIDVELRLLP